MGEISAIEWTDATYNPWRGCDNKRGAGQALLDGRRYVEIPVRSYA